MSQQNSGMSILISPSELPKWVPGEVLCASDGLGWKDVMLRSYRYTGLDVHVPAIDHFMIVRYSVGQTRMERCFDGRWTRTACTPGDASLLTQSQPSHWHWTEDIDVSHIYLSNELLSRVACDVMDRPVAEVRLHDLLRTQDTVITAVADAVVYEAKQHGLGGALYVEALGTQLAVHLLRRYASVSFRDASVTGSLCPALVRRLRAYIDDHLHEAISLEDLARVAGMGVWTFSRHFRQTMGRAPHAFIVNQRIERAKRLLAQGELAVKEVAPSCGFTDQAHMTRVFRARLGTTPGQFRQAARN
jgi:AraC family transcriptional regulator